MITYRLQAWTISPSRAGEFKRTMRPRKDGVFLSRRHDSHGWPREPLQLVKPQTRRLPPSRRHARPESRVSGARSYYSGPLLRCLRSGRWCYKDTYVAPYPGRRPPASPAGHRMIACFGCEAAPF